MNSCDRLTDKGIISFIFGPLVGQVGDTIKHFEVPKRAFME